MISNSQNHRVPNLVKIGWFSKISSPILEQLSWIWQTWPRIHDQYLQTHRLPNLVKIGWFSRKTKLEAGEKSSIQQKKLVKIKIRNDRVIFLAQIVADGL